MKKNVILLLFLIGFVANVTFGQALGYNQNRIAISADGNNQADNLHKWPRADPDDWGATPATLAIFAKLGMQEQLVHFSYNNFIEAPAHTSEVNEMKLGVDGALGFWKFDESRFFDVSENDEIAIKHLAAELSKSTETDPLYFIHMGPAEFFYRAVKLAIDNGHIENLSHVMVISHSGYNDNHLRRGDPKFDKETVAETDKHHTMTEILALSGDRIQYTKIKDQNAGEQPNVLWKSHEDWTVWHWMRDHQDESVRWIYERMLANSKNSADISDAGMVYYLLLGDEDGSPSKFKSFIGNGILTTSTAPAEECTDLTLVGIKDFEVAQIGDFVPAYKDNGRNAIAVNAGMYKNKFAATQKIFEGASSYYNVSLTTLTEEDGESTYRFSVNGELVGEFQNPETTADMQPFVHTFENVPIRKGDLLQIESNTHSNGKIPEGDAFAFSRGRWRSIGFECLNAADCKVEEKEGLLIFEAERFELKGNWKLGKDEDRASGGEYIYYDGPNSYNNVNENNIISYTFHINNPGNYTVKWTMRQPEGERGTDKGNDVYIYFSDDIAWAKNHQITEYEKFYSRSGDDFVLNGVGEVHGVGHSWITAKCPTAGDYTINICGRSHGLQIDRIILYKGISYDEVGLKINEIAETTACSGALTPPEEKVGFLSFPSVIPNNQKEIDIRFNYTAQETRNVQCAVIAPGGTTVATDIVTVEEGTAVKELTLVLPENIEVSDNYAIEVTLLSTDETSPETIANKAVSFKVVDSNSAADKDDIYYIDVPKELAANVLSFPILVGYTATEDRDLNIELKDDVYITSTKKEITAGYGETTIMINLQEPLEVGKTYNLIYAIRPKGGNWKTNIKKVEVKLTITDTPTAIVDHSQKLKVYPNPFREKFQFENQGEVKHYTVLSMLGQQIHSGETQNGMNSINMSREESGIYFLKLDYNNQQSQCIKLLKK